MYKKVLILGPTKNVGGKATFTQLVYKELSIIYKNNISLFDTTRSNKTRKYLGKYPGNNYSFIFTNGLWRILCVISSVFLKKFYFILRILIFKPNYIQIHTSSYFDFWDNSIYILISKIFKIQVILRIGGGGFVDFYSNSSSILKKLIRYFISTPSKIIVQSEYWLKEISKFTNNKSFFIVPNFVDIRIWETSLQIKTKDISKFNLLFIPGNEADIKGYYDIMPVFNELVSEIHNFCLILVGLGRQIEKEYSHLKEKGNLVIKNHIAGFEKINTFKQADIYILPTYKEGFPNTILEAMAAGVAIISTNIEPIKEILTYGINAILIEPGDKNSLKIAIKELYFNVEKRKKIVQTNLQLVKEKYDASRIIDYFDKIYI